MFPGGYGDMCTGMAAVAGINAALVCRANTGKGQIVDTSLLSAGLWTNAFDLVTTQVRN